jgi:hypothetical protein
LAKKSISIISSIGCLLFSGNRPSRVRPVHARACIFSVLEHVIGDHMYHILVGLCFGSPKSDNSTWWSWLAVCCMYLSMTFPLNSVETCQPKKLEFLLSNMQENGHVVVSELSLRSLIHSISWIGFYTIGRVFFVWCVLHTQLWNLNKMHFWLLNMHLCTCWCWF